MTVKYPGDTSSQGNDTLSRIVICVGLALATLWIAIGLINVVLVVNKTAEMVDFNSSQTRELRLEVWLRYMIPLDMQPACYSTDKGVCQIADGYTRGVDFTGYPSEGTDLSFIGTFCIGGIALIPASIVLVLAVKFTGGSQRKSTRTGW